MVITNVIIKDFLVFNGIFTATFCNGVNVFIGANGTGKTTLLKCLYAATDTNGYDASHYFNSPEINKNRDRISRIINRPDERQVELDSLPAVAVFMSSSDDWDKTDNKIYSKINIISSHSEDGKKFNDEYTANPLVYNINKNSVYIPEKDMLSNSKGLPESVIYGKAQFTIFDIDIVMKARVLAYTPEQPLYRKLCDIIGGEPQNDGQSFYMKRPNINTLIPFPLEASGYRKLGLLATLIRNEQIKDDTVLLWDEPENSLNPELIPALVNILLELAQTGVQIFIATHDYNLARHFDVRKNKDISVLYHNLSKTNNGQIVCHSSSEYTKLPDNSFERANVNLFEAVVTNAMRAEDDE